MPIDKPAAGTRGAKPPPRFVSRLVMPLMTWIHRRSGDRFAGMDVLYVHTVGARSGEPRTNPLARMDDGRGGQLVVASAGGAQRHPSWYHNIVAHPEQVWIEFGGRRQHVSVRQLAGEERAFAWKRIVEQVPRFAGYEDKTDRELPVLRLTPDS